MKVVYFKRLHSLNPKPPSPKLNELSTLQAAELANNVEALLMAVKSSNDFEAEMAHRFGGGPPTDEDQDNVSALLHAIIPAQSTAKSC